MGDLKGYSKRILPVSGNPFLKISSSNANGIDEVYRIRNYLAHYSSAAARSLKMLYKEKYGMTRFLEPGHFVLGHNARRLWAYFDSFAGASADMKEAY